MSGHSESGSKAGPQAEAVNTTSADLSNRVPLISVASLVESKGSALDTAAEIGAACREHGFFYVSDHGIPAELESRLERLSRDFFKRETAEKLEISMSQGGHAWRGYFPVGGELTSGKPDLKEGIYFGSELASTDPRVRAGLPLHGANLFPEEPSELKAAVLEYIERMTELGHALMRGIALSLGLEEQFFSKNYTGDPLVLFRTFNYPAPASSEERGLWGVGEHTDYGLLTILKQDDCGGLEVKTRAGWISAPPIPGTFVCNIGDMLDRLTAGLYRSTPHRVRNTAGRDRVSFPFFFDPSFSAEVRPLPISDAERAKSTGQPDRWDGADLQAFQGTYGEYLLKKVGKVFPDLGSQVL